MEQEKKLNVAQSAQKVKTEKSPLDLWRMMKGKSKFPSGKGAVDAVLAVYKSRLTYTFILDREVASIHFNQEKGEIFFKGNNIKYMSLTNTKKEALNSLKEVLADDKQGRELLADYSATLGKLLADK